MLGRLKFELDELANEMLDQLPEELFRSKTTTFLDPYMGGGQFVKEIEARLRRYGHSDKNISQRVFGVESSELRVNYAVNKYGLVGQYFVCENYLEYDEKMKFDVVIGNPPYLKGGWRKFVTKMMGLSSRIVASVNPDPTANSSSYANSFKDELLTAGVQVKKDCTDAFPTVNSGKLCYFVADRNQEPNTDALVDKSTVGVIVTKVLGKKVDDGAFFARVGHATFKKEQSDQRTNNLTEAVIVSMTKEGMVVRYMNSKDLPRKPVEDRCKGRFLVMNRFFGKNNPDPIAVVARIEDYRPSLNVIIFKMEKKETVKNFRSVYGSKLYREVINYMRQGGFDIQTTYLNQLPRLDLTRTWTDEELYEHFGLTQEEIDYIEATVK